MASTKPVVTIGVCVRNSASTIREAIESVINQGFPHELMEVIFVDDGSEDGTLSIINSYVQKIDMRVKVFHHEWKGLGPSRNIVVNNADGDYILWIDGDMTLPKDHIQKQVEFMEQNSKVGIAKAKYGMSAEENIISTLENITFVIEDALAQDEWKTNLKLPGTGGSIYRVDAIRQIGGFDDNLKRVGEDQDAAYRIKAAHWSIYRTKTVFYEKRSKTWKALWNKYFRYGYGNCCVYRKNRSIFSIHKMIPPAALIGGMLNCVIAYRLTRLKTVFLLPIHSTFKTTAWCLGFVKGQIDFMRGYANN